MNYPHISKIVDTKKETKDIKTNLFEHPENINPGQFFMIWVPGVDEIPMSVSYIDKETKGITFRDVGKATHALFGLKKGDKVTTTGGIYGKINDVKERTVTLEIADNVLVKVDKTAVTADPGDQPVKK